MLKKYYSRAATKDGEAKKDGVTVTLVASWPWRTSFSSSGD
jgi:short-subunit dehydrogenase